MEFSHDGPAVVIEFDEPVHIDDIEAGSPEDPQPRAGFSVWARWRNGVIVAFAAPDTLENVKKNFWDACLIQYVSELRIVAGAIRN